MMRLLIIAPEESLLDYGKEIFLDWIGMQNMHGNSFEVLTIALGDPLAEFLDKFEPDIVLAFVADRAAGLELTLQLYAMEQILEIREFQTVIIREKVLNLPIYLPYSAITLGPAESKAVRMLDNGIRH